MKLNKEQARQTLEKTIKEKLRHQDYNRVTELKALYTRHITGEGLEKDIEQFKPRENDAALEQRKRLTKVINAALSGSVMKPFYKVPRTDRVTKKIIVNSTDNKEAKDKIIEQLQQKMDLFYGSDNEEGGLDFWIKNRFVELSFSDPNCFIVIEFSNTDEGLTPYPFEVNADMAINFDIENNNIHWLIAEQDIKYRTSADDPLKIDDGKRYTIYCGDFSIVMRQVHRDDVVAKIDLQDNEILQDVGDKRFAISEYDTKLKDWQMFRIGYARDLHTDSRTFVSPLHESMCYFKKAVDLVSEHDLTNASHVFPQKYQYVSQCQGEIKDGVPLGCIGGRTREGSVCSVCHGTGARVHKSSQDVITIPLPDNKDEIFPLTEMMAYFSPPIELLEFQNKVIDDLEPKIHQAVFNSTVLVKKTVVATATEKNLDMDSIYDTLTKFASKASACYLNIANAIATLMRIQSVSFVYRYPSDFQMKSRTTLYAERKTAMDSGAPSFVLESIDDETASVIYQDDPDGMLQYLVKKKFVPFRGKTEDQISLALNSNLTPMAKKVLYINFDDIFQEAEMSEKNFYVKKYDKQKEVIDKIVERYINELQPATPTIPPITETEEEVEEEEEI